jgi:hypothetical protein
MQTFLPYKDFAKSATMLDKQRCWKQVVEAAQIIDILEGRKTSWANHPAVKMWEGYTKALKVYFNAMLWQSKNIHGINTKYNYLDFGTFNYEKESPWWLGKKKFHRSHRARLIDKKPEFYLPLFPDDKGYNNGKYWWPVNETKSFRII